MRNTFIPATVLVASLAFMPNAHAADSDDAAALETVVITATRTEQSASDSLSAVSVITAADIERLQARNIMDILSGQSGISVANSGGDGKLTTIFMRGTSSNHVLVLINGMRFGSTTAGLAALQDIPVDQVERIEIVRGPRAALYGTDAIGGVIQVFTRHAETGMQANAELTAGSFGRKEVSAGVGERFEQAWYRVDLAHSKLDGFDSCVNSGTEGCFAVEPDDDGYENNSVSGRVGYEFSHDNTLELDAWQADGETQYDGFYNRTDYTRRAINLRSRSTVRDNWTLDMRAGRSNDDSRNFGSGFSGYADTQREEFSVQSDISLDDFLVSVGADLREDSVESDTPYDQASRETNGAFGQVQYTGDGWSADASARYTDDDQFGSESTGSAAFGYDLDDQWNSWLSYGTAYHAPTFNDLYYPGFSNPSLVPETSRTTELGLRYNDVQRLDISLYETELDELIEFDFATFMPVNISSARIRGLEVRWEASIADWNYSIDATLLDTENLSPTYNGNELPRRAGQSLRIDADRAFDSWSVGASVIAENRRYDDLGNTTELPGYATLDLRTSWFIDASWELALRVGNALDTGYQTVYGYNQAGRNGQLSLRYRY